MNLEPPPPRSSLPGGPDVVTAEWRRRTQAEYASAAIAHHVTLWLIQLGAPPDLIRDGLRVVDDELAHSELSADVARTAARAAVPPVIEPAALKLPDAGDPLRSITPVLIRFFCIGETLAVPLFRMLRERSTVPVSRRALDRVLKDEGRHRQFGWDVLDWLILSAGPRHFEQVKLEVPGMVDAAARAYAACPRPTASDEGSFPQDVSTWGMAPRSDYARVVMEALRRDVVPRLAERGLAPAVDVP